MSASGKCHLKHIEITFRNGFGSFDLFSSLLKVSSCNLSEGQQWYFHQHIESTALQCKLTSVESKYLFLCCTSELRLLYGRQSCITKLYVVSMHQRAQNALQLCYVNLHILHL